MMLGDVIKKTRLENRMTIKEVSEKANVTISLLSQIENNKINPSINSLLSTAKALNVKLSYFFDNHDLNSSPVIKSYKRRAIHTPTGMTYYLLTPVRKNNLVDFKYIVFEIGGSAGSSHTHNGEECGIILEGRLEVVHSDETYILETGDSIYLDSSKPHTVRNIYNGRTIAIWVDSPPPSESYI